MVRQPAVRPAKPRKDTGPSKDIPQAVRELVKARSGGRCEAGLINVCHGTATNMHHRRRRNISPAHTAPNLLHLCGSGTTGCHGWITQHPAAASEPGAGWIVSSYAQPENEPVRIRGRLCWLTDDGRYVVAGPTS